MSGDQPPRPALADLERAAAEHWQAADRAALGEWLLRAAGGFTGRANSALPLGDPGMPLGAAVDAVTAWYRSRGLPAMIEVAAAHRRGGLGTAMTLALARAAAERGVDRVFLQVEEGNSAARAFYARCGFRDAHAYHYRVAPSEA